MKGGAEEHNGRGSGEGCGRDGGALTVDQSIKNELAVLFHQVVDVSENATVERTMISNPSYLSIDLLRRPHSSSSPAHYSAPSQYSSGPVETQRERGGEKMITEVRRGGR